MKSDTIDRSPSEASQPPPPRQDFGRAGIAARIARLVIMTILRLFFRVRVEGREHLPQSGPYMVAATHHNWADAFLLVAALPAEPRPWMLGDKTALEATAFRRTMLNLFGGVIPIARGRRIGDEAALTAAVRVLQGNGALVIFPEGTVEAEEGEMRPLQRGVSHIYLRAPVPVVPVAIAGTKELYLGKPMTITIGPAFTPDPGTGALPARVSAVTGQIDAAMRSLVQPYQPPEAGRKPLRNRLTNLFP